MKFRAGLLSSIATAILFSPAAWAGDMAHRTTEKIIEAYGGAKFENLKTLKMESDLRYGWLGQGQYPDYTDLEPMRKLYHYDLVKGWGSEEAWGGGGSYAERVFTTDNGQYTVNYLNKSYEHDPDGDFYGHFGGEIRTTDFLLAYDLVKHRNTAEHKGEKMFRGVPHELITYDMPGTNIDPVLWVNSETGLISKMRRVVPDAFVLNYVFGDHKKARGISYASDFELYADDKLIEYAKSIDVSVGWIGSKIWKMDRGVEAQGELIASDEMVVDHIGGSVHHAGQGGAWGAFVDAGDHIIGIGGYGGLADRFNAYQEAQGSEKPLKYLIVTHHHADHLDSVPDAIELGAKIVGPESSRANLEEVMDRPLTAAEFQVVSGGKTPLGPVDIYLISTGHAPEFALPFIRAQKIIYDEDHYSGQRKDGASWISANMMTMISEVKRIGIEPETLLTTHGRKAEKWSAIMEKSKSHVPGKCPTGRPICHDLLK